jgi:protein-tyrosine phosphatase
MMEKVVRVLMVCLGNICRSPMAEGWLGKLSEECSFRVQVDSAGTGSWHEGECPDIRAIEAMQRNGIDISGQRARPLVADDFFLFDFILVMDSENLIEVNRRCPEARFRQKIHLLSSFAWPGENRAVRDPYYGKSEGFDEVSEMIRTSCILFLKKLEE